MSRKNDLNSIQYEVDFNESDFYAAPVPVKGKFDRRQAARNKREQRYATMEAAFRAERKNRFR